MKIKKQTILRIILFPVCLYLAFLTCGFFAIKYGLTNTSGAVDASNDVFQKAQEKVAVASEPDSKIEELKADDVSSDLGNKKVGDEIKRLEAIKRLKDENACKLVALQNCSDLNAKKIFDVYQTTKNDVLVSKMITAAGLRLKDDQTYQNKTLVCEKADSDPDMSGIVLGASDPGGQEKNLFPWANEEEWASIKGAILKDKPVIEEAAAQAKMEPRLIVAALIVEQLRLFHSQRELFKKFFEPLKILGNSTKISLGVMGVKEATAIDTENHLKDPSSPYYLGADYEHLLDLDPFDQVQERFARLTDDKNHYYAYLYGAVYMKEMMTQWAKAGYDIQYRPEIVGTLFNVGFPQSKPNPDPKVGGSKIQVGDGAYSFGSLAYEFYYSGELVDEFPYVTKD